MAKAAPAFDLTAPLFTIGEVAAVSGSSRATLDMYLHRGILVPARREAVKGTRSRGQGRPIFSAVEVFKARLIRQLIDSIGLGPSESSALADAAVLAKAPAIKENWMRAVAQGVLAGKPFLIYAVATRLQGEWKLEITREMEATRRAESLYVLVPVSRLFSEVYSACGEFLK
jgi:DNA-binding transcriptional MerR regulator